MRVYFSRLAVNSYQASRYTIDNASSSRPLLSMHGYLVSCMLVCHMIPLLSRVLYLCIDRISIGVVACMYDAHARRGRTISMAELSRRESLNLRDKSS